MIKILSQKDNAGLSVLKKEDKYGGSMYTHKQVQL